MIAEQKLSFEEYQKIDAMNASTLVHGCKSMKALKRALDGEQSPPTNAMRFGTKYHEMILEPWEFIQRFVVMPDYAKDPENCTSAGAKSTSSSTKFVKQSRAHFYEMNADREVIDQRDYDRALSMLRAIEADPFASNLVKELDREVTMQGEISGVPFKGRADLLGEKILADVKGTNCVSVGPFGNIAARLRYAFKMAIYRELAKQNGMDIREVYLIAVETDGDFDCCVYSMPEPLLDQAYKEVCTIVQRYQYALKRDVWDGVNQGMDYLLLHVPSWAMPDDDDLEWN